MRLTAEEKKMLRADCGRPVQEALQLQLDVGRFFGPKRFVPVSNVHMMGDIEVMGDSGKSFLERAARLGAKCATDDDQCTLYRFCLRRPAAAGS